MARIHRWGFPEGIVLLACLTAILCVDVVKEKTSSEEVSGLSVVPTDKLQSSKSPSSSESDTSFLEMLGIETQIETQQLNQNDHSVSVETTLNTASPVQTNTKINSVDNRDILTSSKDYKKLGTEPRSETLREEDVRLITLSPTLSAEKLLIDENLSDSITLTLTNKSLQSDEAEVEPSKIISSSSSSTSSIVISVPSIFSVMSSSTATPILPSAPTTSASDEITIVTTNPLNDDELIRFETVEHSNSQYSSYDFRAAVPQTVHEINPTTTLGKIEITAPSYPRANPNRIGILDTETEDDSDYFLSHKAPLKSGGPLNQGRSSVDGINQENTRLLKKSNRRADPGPDINDILSGLLNVVGEGLHIATNYVQENNKRKQQEKLDNESSKEDMEEIFLKKRNRTRTNNRGPPLLSAIPFEAIPLEVLNNQRPGVRPGVAIPQRPFQTRLPGFPTKVPSPPPMSTKSKKPSTFASQSGIPLPEQLVPTSESVKSSALPSQLPTRSDYTPDFTETENDDETKLNETDNLANEISTGDKTLVTEKTVPTSQSSTTIKKEPSNEPIVPTLKAVPTDPYSALYSTDFKAKQITTTTPTQPTPVVIEPSFTTSLLVTPPSTPRNIRRPLKRRPVVRPWGNQRPPRPSGRPPRPQQKWPVDKRPQTSFPTPPLQTTQRPLVFPTRQRDPAIVTGIAIPSDNDIIELTVQAQQNFGGSRKNKKKYQEYGGIITRARPGDQFVSIDGKRTYFDIEPTKAPSVTRPRPPGQGAVRGATLQIGGKDVYKPTRKPFDKKKYGPVVGSALPVEPVELNPTVNPQVYVPIANRKTTTPPRPGPTRRPPAPPVRIDTCIVGNDNTCKIKHHEICKTYLGVSSCYCKPGYGRKNHRLLCKKIVRLLMSMKIDRIQDDRIKWNNGYENQNTEEYQVLEGEVNYAIGSAMALTSFSNLYMGNEVNKFFSMNGAVTVNTTIEMEENSYTKSEIVKRDIKNKLIEVIQARANNIGSGNLYVAGPFNPIPGVEDFNECSEPEYNDCGDYSVCVNYFGGFTCQCLPGYGDRFSRDILQAGRHCESCPQDFCSNRGQCSIEEGSRICRCTGNFYGAQCQVDGEVLAVAIGASVAAVIIIILTLICLCMWSRRWKREQQKTDISRTFPRSYMVGNMPPPPTYMTNKMAGWAAQPSPAYHRGTIDSQLRWAHHLDASGQNIYAQPVVYGGGQHIYAGDPVYMSPPEPPLSIYGTLPRNAGNLIRVRNSPLSSHYATFRKERLGPRVSLKLMQMMNKDKDDAQDTMSIISGFTENSGFASRDKILEDQFHQGISFGRLPSKREEADFGHLQEPDLRPEAEKAGDPMVETCLCMLYHPLSISMQ